MKNIFKRTKSIEIENTILKEQLAMQKSINDDFMRMVKMAYNPETKENLETKHLIECYLFNICQIASELNQNNYDNHKFQQLCIETYKIRELLQKL